MQRLHKEWMGALGDLSWWEAQGEWVEPPNQRRGGTSGVQRVVDAASGVDYYVKRQVNHLYRDLRFPAGRPTLLREWLNLRRCAVLGVPSAACVFFDMRKRAGQWEAVLVTRGLTEYVSLEDGIKQRQWQSEQRREILLRLARILVPLHRARRKHGHLYPKEIFVRTQPTLDIALVDWEVSRRALSARRAAYSDLSRLSRSLTSLDVPLEERQAFLAHYETLSGIRGVRSRAAE